MYQWTDYLYIVREMDGGIVTRYKYKVLDHCSESAYEIKCDISEEDADWIAHDAAEDYHNNHDGWESSWPLTFLILQEDETIIGKYSVDRDVAPVFHAYKYKESK